jgi:beta-galactosidase
MHKKAFLMGGFTFSGTGPSDTLLGLQDSPMRVKPFSKLALAITLKAVALSVWTVTALAGPTNLPRERLLFNADWRFIKGDPAGVGDQLSYPVLKDWLKPSAQAFAKVTNALPSGARPGEQVAYVRPEFNDHSWRALDLPHDWAVEGPFDQSLPGETAKLPYAGIAWYRKAFTLPASDAGRQIYLDVDGAMSFAAVWLNGHFVGGWPYGYSSWRVDLTPFANIGGTNVLAIRLDNPPLSSRWYPGAGIYRNVWLVKSAPIHIAHWGTKIRYAIESTTGSHNPRNVVHVQTRVDHCAQARGQVVLETRILDPKGKEVASGRSPIPTSPGDSHQVDQDFSIAKPQLWTLDSPRLYRAVSRVFVNDQEVDTLATPFGLRTFQFTTDKGFLLNGERVPIQGVCLHHDFGALGAAFNLRAAERQLELMRELGANAIRTSHNPAAPEFLDLCDRMGFLVMEEAFDAWRMTKRTNDYSILFDDWHEADLRAMIRRDYNHPSIILWSLGNEVYEQREGTNAWLAEKLAAIAHDEDATRPVNMALHVVAASTNGFQKALDVFGYNYTPFGYAAFRSNNPVLPLIGSETTSTVSTRGEYYFPVSTNRKDGRMDFQATSYDYAAPSWAYMPDTEFKALDENPFVAGEFVWTGLDYLGEPTPYDTDTKNRLLFSDTKRQADMDALLAAGKKIPVPSRSSYFGIMDLCGFPKDRFYLYQARWRPELPLAHILPHWNWPERVGQVTPVYVYTSGDEAELFLNGKSLGRKQRGKLEYRLRWDDVVYQPGTLKVVTYRNGKRWATNTMKTAGPAAKIQLTPDRKRIAADGQDLSFVTVTITDEEGILAPRAKNRVRFIIEGVGELIATDNGDPISHESFQQAERAAFNGMALAVVRSQAGQRGRISLKAEAAGLKSAQVRLDSK